MANIENPSATMYFMLIFSPSLSVASMATESRKTMGPSFNPCDDQSTRLG